jgi:hypothetical protein
MVYIIYNIRSDMTSDMFSHPIQGEKLLGHLSGAACQNQACQGCWGWGREALRKSKPCWALGRAKLSGALIFSATDTTATKKV